MHATDREIAAVLIKNPSCLEPRPKGVLITNCTNPLVIRSLADN